ncbi:MAG: flavin reductase family protein [Lacisediminihabitans sp.]
MIATPHQTTGFNPESTLYRPRQHYFRGSLGRFATGVAVVTFDGSEKRRGITVNSFTSVSMEPPLVLVSVARTTKAHDELMNRPFTVNVLGAEQQLLASNFAGKPNEEPRWVEGDVAPRLAGVLSYFECKPWAAYDGGDHTLFLGEVVNFDYRSGDALGFVNGQFAIIPEYLLGHEALL